MTPDDRDEQKPPRSPQAGNSFLLAGAIVAPAAVTIVALTPLEPWVHDILLFGPGLVLIVGIVLKVAERVIAAFQRHVKDLMRQQAHVEDEIGEKNSLLAAQLDANNQLLRQLTAQPTVRLEEVKRELRAIGDEIGDRSEGVARDLTVNAIEDLKKSSGSRYQALTDQVAELGARVDLLVGRQEAAGAAGVVDIEDARLLKRLDEKVRRASAESGAEQ